ncbi:MAG TPA: hypothetical protein VIJ64_11115 [Candidatus Lustribacter sp.]
MRIAPLPSNESGRLQALADYQLLDTLEEMAYDAFTQLACEITGSNISTISLIDANRQWLKSVTLPRRIDRHAAPRTVLLLDVERDRSFLAYGLQEAGFRVLNASGIDEALAIADSIPFDAVVISAPESLSPQAAVQFRTFSRERSIAITDVVAALERLLAPE